MKALLKNLFVILLVSISIIGVFTPTQQVLADSPSTPWLTFLGGNGIDSASDIAVDSSGNIYITGYSDAAWQGVPEPVQAYTPGNNAYVAKLNSNGVLQWHTFLNYGFDIAVDSIGNVYVVGKSSATWQGASDPVRAYTAGDDAFVAKFNSNGVLQWNTFLGGDTDDWGYGIDVDASGNIYITGTSHTTWQGASAPMRAYTASADAFVAKLNSNGVLQWNTFLGGSDYDDGTSIKADGNGNVCVVGLSSATWQGASAPVRAYTPGTDSFSDQDVFAAKLNSSGIVQWNTFLGGSDYDSTWGLAVDGSGNVYIPGQSYASWQGTSAPVRTFTYDKDAFAAKLNSSGALQWNTFLGGGGDDYGSDIAVDPSGNVYTTGQCDATWQGTSDPVRAYTASTDAFVAKLNSGGVITWNTFLGGSGVDACKGIAVDNEGNIFVAGLSDANWQSTSPPVRAYTSDLDAFAAKLNNSGFIEPTYTLATSVSPPAAGAAGCNVTGNAGTYQAEDQVNLTANPASGWQFVNWTGDFTDSNATLSFTMPANNVSVTANFSQITHTLTININGQGSTTPSVGTHTYNEGEEVEISATPAEGWEFIGWSGDASGTGSPTITMNSNKTVTANFNEIPLTTTTTQPPTTTTTQPQTTTTTQPQTTTTTQPPITTTTQPPTQEYKLIINTSGSGEAIGTGFYTAGNRVDIVAVPGSDDWVFDCWTGDIATCANPNAAHTTITIDKDLSLTANFVQRESGDEEQAGSGFPIWIIGVIIGGIAIIALGGFLVYRQYGKTK